MSTPAPLTLSILWKAVNLTPPLHSLVAEEANTAHPAPTDAQKEAGNYRKGHVRWHGLDITIETPKGRVRAGRSGAWAIKLPAHYGYIRQTDGHDGDHVDCYLGPDLHCQTVYVVNQNKGDSGTFDEHKCFLGFASEQAARKAYDRAYTPDWKGFGSLVALSLPQFKTWLAKGDKHQPITAEKRGPTRLLSKEDLMKLPHVRIRIRHTRLSKAPNALPAMHALPPTTPAYHAAAPEQVIHAQQQAAPDSQALHQRGGQYTPERQAHHNKIIHHFVSGGDQGTDQHLHSLYHDYAQGQPQKHAIFMVGGAGSGKSTYARKKFLKHPRFVSIDPDAIKEHLAQASGDPGGHNTRPSFYHEESSDVAKKLQDATHAAGKSYVFDGTGANARSLATKMQKAKAAGYQVHLHYASVPVETALRRNQMRARKVPEEVLRAQHAQVRDSFSKVRHLADKSRVIDLSDTHISPYAAAREKRLQTRDTSPMEKAMAHKTGLKRVTFNDHHYAIGEVKDGHFHVHDIVHHGTSEVRMTGQKPDLRPIPLDRIQREGGVFSDEPSHH